MPFPDSPRVVYDQNVLEEVICQIKFPPILKIDSELPAAFQDEIRVEYPLFQEAPGIALDLPPELAKMVPALGGTKSYTFESTDRSWTVGLNREFIALSTKRYIRWEQFRQRLTTVLHALARHYQPAFFVRVGLRYRDVIKRSLLGFDDVDWSELLQPWILGELADPTVAPYIQQAVRDVVISLNHDNGQVRLRHGLLRPPEGGEPFYSIDGDYFKEGQTEAAHVIDLLNVLNREAGRLFRWCIKDRLHEGLRPQPVALAQ